MLEKSNGGEKRKPKVKSPMLWKLKDDNLMPKETKDGTRRKDGEGEDFYLFPFPLLSFFGKKCFHVFIYEFIKRMNSLRRCIHWVHYPNAFTAKMHSLS